MLYDIVYALIIVRNRKKLNNSKMIDYRGRAKELMIESGKVRGAILHSGERIYADRVIVATGGRSYPQTGSTGDGYEFARQAGHTVRTLNLARSHRAL